MCDVLSGGPGMCDKVWQEGEGVKIGQNSVTYFMDGPLADNNTLATWPQTTPGAVQNGS